MKIQCPFCSEITELEHVDHGSLIECICSRRFEVNESSVQEEYTEIDNQLPEKIGPYPVTGLLGFGGMGKVYLGRHYALDLPVAIKMLRMEYMTDESACERFIQAARICAKLTHPNIVRVYDCGYFENNVFLVMEYISGGSAMDLLEQQGVLTCDQAAFIMLEVCTGLLEAEKRGIVHRDIKPENIMFDQDGTVKILDLGLSKISGDKRLNQKTITGSLISLGTAQYMAPEQAVDAANCDSRADVYSIGVTLYQFCTGKLPFESPDQSELRRMHAQDAPIPPSEVDPSVSMQMEQIILHCLEKKREQRYSSISALALDLEALLKNRILPSTLSGKKNPQGSFSRKKVSFQEKTGIRKDHLIWLCAVIFSALLLAGAVLLLTNLSMPKTVHEQIEKRSAPSSVTPESVMDLLARQATPHIEKMEFKKASQLYLHYQGKYKKETEKQRHLIARGLLISQSQADQQPLPGNVPPDKGSDRSR